MTTLEEQLNEMVRDFTQVTPRPKSEVRERITTYANRLLQERADAIREELDVWCDAQKQRWQSDGVVNRDFAQGVQSGYGWMKYHLPHVFDKTLECRCPGREHAASIVEEGLSA